MNFKKTALSLGALVTMISYPTKATELVVDDFNVEQEISIQGKDEYAENTLYSNSLFGGKRTIALERLSGFRSIETVILSDFGSFDTGTKSKGSMTLSYGDEFNSNFDFTQFNVVSLEVLSVDQYMNDVQFSFFFGDLLGNEETQISYLNSLDTYPNTVYVELERFQTIDFTSISSMGFSIVTGKDAYDISFDNFALDVVQVVPLPNSLVLVLPCILGFLALRKTSY